MQHRGSDKIVMNTDLERFIREESYDAVEDHKEVNIKPEEFIETKVDNKIKFTDISNTMLKICSITEFNKFKSIKPKNIEEIHNLSDYVSLKISTLSV